MAKLYYKVVAMLLGSLGLACEKSTTDVEYGPVVEYGMPHAQYKLSGQVVKASDQSPLEAIEVAFDDTSVVTDADGNWSLEKDSYALCGIGSFEPCTLFISDVDGPAGGGEFGPTSSALELIQTESGDGSWFLGVFEQHDIITELIESAKK